MAIVKHGAQDEATEIEYDNTTSGLTAVNVQAAIDELKANQPVYLNNLTDVTTNSIQTNQYLKWNGVDWVNADIISDAIFTKSYTSSDQTIVRTGTLTLAHGFGENPKFIQCVLKCITANLGYSVNDETIVNPSATSESGSDSGLAITYDTTNIYVRFGDSVSVMNIIEKDTGVVSGITIGSWKLIVKAWS